MNKSIVRSSIDSLANQAPHFYRMMSSVGEQRRRRRTNRVAREAGWLGAGLVLGAGLTTLFTPRTGAEIRRQLSDQAMRVRDSLAPRSNGATGSATRKKEISS